MKTIDDLIEHMVSKRIAMKEIRNQAYSDFGKTIANEIIDVLNSLIDMAKEIKDNEK